MPPKIIRETIEVPVSNVVVETNTEKIIGEQVEERYEEEYEVIDRVPVDVSDKRFDLADEKKLEDKITE